MNDRPLHLLDQLKAVARSGPCHSATEPEERVASLRRTFVRLEPESEMPAADE
jgi:hypothetical protein